MSVPRHSSPNSWDAQNQRSSQQHGRLTEQQNSEQLQQYAYQPSRSPQSGRAVSSPHSMPQGGVSPHSYGQTIAPQQPSFPVQPPPFATHGPGGAGVGVSSRQPMYSGQQQQQPSPVSYSPQFSPHDSRGQHDPVSVPAQAAHTVYGFGSGQQQFHRNPQQQGQGQGQGQQRPLSARVVSNSSTMSSSSQMYASALTPSQIQRTSALSSSRPSRTASPAMVPTPSRVEQQLQSERRRSGTGLNLRVLQAFTGREFNSLVSLSNTVNNIQMWLAQHADTPMEDQILLCENGAKMAEARPLSAYVNSRTRTPTGEQKVAADDLESSNAAKDETIDRRGSGAELVIYMYNRRHLDGSARVKPMLDPEAFKTQLPLVPDASLTASHPLSRSASIMVRNLPHYEQSFKHHLDKAHAYIESASAKIRAAWDIDGCRQVQQRSLKVLLRNLQGHCDHMKGKFEPFLETFQAQVKEHQDLMHHFESDLAQLREVDLHPKLRKPERQTLLDCVSESKLRQWAHTCRSDHEKLRSKVQQAVDVYEDVNCVMAETLKEVSMREPTALVKELEQSDQIRQEQNAMYAALAKDLSNVQELIRRVSTEMTASQAQEVTISVVDSIAAFEEQDTMHQRQIMTRYQKLDELLLATLRSFVEAQVKATEEFLRQLALVSSLQSRISQVNKRRVGYGEAMRKEKQIFQQLVLVKHMPRAYHACLVEVVRRRVFHRRFKEIASRSESEMVELQENEAKERLNFVQAYGPYLPANLFKGLKEMPPSFRLQFQNMQDTLPEIDEADLPSLSGDAAEAKGVASPSTDSPKEDTDSPKEDTHSRKEDTHSPKEDMKEDTKEDIAAEPAQSSSEDEKQTAAAQAEADREKRRAAQIQQQNDELKRRVQELEEELKSARKLAEQPAPSTGANSPIAQSGDAYTSIASTDMTPSQMKVLLQSSGFTEEIKASDKTENHAEESEREASDKTETQADASGRGKAKDKEKQQSSAESASKDKEESEKDRKGKEKERRSTSEDMKARLKKMEQRLKVAAQWKQQLTTCQANSADLENQLHGAQQRLALIPELESSLETAKARGDDLEGQLQRREEAFKQLLSEKGTLEDNVDMWQTMCHARLSYTSFQARDKALFYRTTGGHYTAFNHGCPHHYLSQETETAMGDKNRLGPFVVGQIIMKVKRKVHEEKEDADGLPDMAGVVVDVNPFNLPPGTEYFVVDAELEELAPQEASLMALLCPPVTSAESPGDKPVARPVRPPSPEH